MKHSHATCLPASPVHRVHLLSNSHRARPGDLLHRSTPFCWRATVSPAPCQSHTDIDLLSTILSGARGETQRTQTGPRISSSSDGTLPSPTIFALRCCSSSFPLQTHLLKSVRHPAPTRFGSVKRRQVDGMVIWTKAASPWHRSRFYRSARPRHISDLPAPAHLEAHAHVNSALGPAGDHCFENIPLWGVCSQATPLTRIRLDFAHSRPPQSTPARLSRLSPPALTWSTLQRWPHSCRPVENAALYTSQCSGRRPEVAAAPSVSTLARSAGAATASPSCAPLPAAVLVPTAEGPCGKLPRTSRTLPCGWPGPMWNVCRTCVRGPGVSTRKALQQWARQSLAIRIRTRLLMFAGACSS